MPSARLRFWVAAAAALAAGTAVRAWFIAHEARIAGDTLVYGDIAKNLLQHGVYGFSQATSSSPLAAPRPTLIRLPGYPLFLAACFSVFGMEHYRAVLFVQCFADMLTCVVLAMLSARLFGTRGALLTLSLGCLCPFMASYVAAPLTETLTLLTIAVAFYGLERWRDSVAGLETAAKALNGWLLLTSVAMTFSLLLRPEQGLLAAAIVPAILWVSLRSRGAARPQWTAAGPALIAALCVVAPLIPWTARNYGTFHVFQPLAPRYANDPGEAVPSGFQRWYRTWGIDFISTDNAYWKYDGDTINVADLPTRAFDTQEEYEQTAALLTTYNDTTTASPELDRRFAEIARARIQVDPIRYYLALPAARVFNMMFRPRTEMLPLPLDWWRWANILARARWWRG